MCNYSKNFLVVISQPFSDFQIGGKYNNEKRQNKQTVCLYLVTGFSDSSSNTSDDSNGNWKRSKRVDGNELTRKRVRYFFLKIISLLYTVLLHLKLHGCICKYGVLLSSGSGWKES